MIIIDIALMALIASAIVGLLTWSIFTQHRHHGCEDLRVSRPTFSAAKQDAVSQAGRPEAELIPHGAITANS